ncbi:nuclear transport factor 2 family protein [Exilibacterium tricleocarpae]|uniref:Nuclear transport factor 2 family protein n=1 Tax=Exilibacterium tricleocarpae TaxID=2591008 RepID=A0A545ST87_9GAMM|nr:nuclear transport factor 2 family protein [Exilibacterium tricleocarpae]TQV68187.1 nuclear transport factor 2 family protein [Exilibacterium tricleocarpae]
MKPSTTALICFTLFSLFGCTHLSDANRLYSSSTEASLNNDGFERLLNRVADDWNRGDARAAADCFTPDAVYIEPPDRQLYEGRQALFEFFGGEEGRTSPMTIALYCNMSRYLKELTATTNTRSTQNQAGAENAKVRSG